ncbi:MAG: exodeoxyribonuclease VII small subunit [Spirochaetales bacterium]|nr:exodeoxyribonuclease VII small subunit [Spirochaetales bacterium]
MKEISFESALKRLEEIAVKMEEGKLPLDESVKLYEEGIKLSKYCNWKLSDVDQKVEIVNQLEITEDDIAKMESPQVKKTASTQKKKAKEVEKKIEEEDIDLPFFVSEEEVYHS